jgi:hypothetical protein
LTDFSERRIHSAKILEDASLNAPKNFSAVQEHCLPKLFATRYSPFAAVFLLKSVFGCCIISLCPVSHLSGAMSMGTMKRLETTQRILKEHLGSDHAIVQLHRQTVSFVSAVHGAPFIPRHSAQQVLSQIVPENSSATVLLYAPAGFGKTTLLSNWALSLDCALAVHFFSRAPEFFGLASNPSFAFAHLVVQVFAIKQIWDEGRGTGTRISKAFLNSD